MKKAAVLITLLLVFTVSASQIEISSFVFDPEEPNPGDVVTISFRVTNKAYKESAEVTCRLFINGAIHDVKVVPVSPRSSAGVSFVWLAQPGEHVFSLQLSYYTQHTEQSQTVEKTLYIVGTEEKIDYFSEAVSLYEKGSYLQAKILFEQAKRLFEEESNTESAVQCEEYIQKCDQYMEANQLCNQGDDAYTREDYMTAVTYYQQAQSLYITLGDENEYCTEKIQEIETILEKQKKQTDRPYYVLLLLPVAAAVIAFFWLRRQEKPPELPDYEPEYKKFQEKPLFKEEDARRSETLKELHDIESKLDTKNPQTFKSLIQKFKETEQVFEEKKDDLEEAPYIEKSIGALKQKIKYKGEQLQQIQKLHTLEERCDELMNNPVGDLVEAYNRYAQLRNVFDDVPDMKIPEQEKVRNKLDEYYRFIQKKAKSQPPEQQ
ncbi:MAG: hypothetical protein PVF58_05450 [Candidatus Methanofastidiosia archaeon]|jgi:hypothetical protein